MDLGFRAESVTDPLIISDASNLTFCFLTVSPKDDGVCENSGLAIFRSKSCLIYKSGYPNDEASLCSPLVATGFDGFSISKVIDSDWVKEIEGQNSKKWPNTNYSNRFSHWVFPFKDTTLEVIAADLEWELTEKPYSEVQIEMVSWINDNEY